MANTQMIGARAERDENDLIKFTIPYYIADKGEALDVGLAAPLGLKEVGRTLEDREGLKGYVVNVSYAGFENGRDEGTETFEFEPNLSEEPITAHPRWVTIKILYDGRVNDAGKAEFPETLKKAGGGLRRIADGGDTEKNPLFGVESYFALQATLRHTYTLRSLPSDLLDRIGEVVSSVPGGYPTPEGRDWLRMPPKVSEKGNAFQIIDEYLLSQQGGKWPKDLYDNIVK